MEQHNLKPGSAAKLGVCESLRTCVCVCVCAPVSQVVPIYISSAVALPALVRLRQLSGASRPRSCRETNSSSVRYNVSAEGAILVHQGVSFDERQMKVIIYIQSNQILDYGFFFSPSEYSHFTEKETKPVECVCSIKKRSVRK